MYLGLNVYHWGRAEQRRLLTEALAPAARRFRRQGLCELFWHTAFDRRGPHLFALFRPTAGRQGELAAAIRHELGGYLERRPSAVELPAEVLAERDRQCRGKALCALDREGGFAANNSLHLFDHPADGYPLRLARGLGAAERFWHHLDRLVFWALGALAGGPTTAAAVRFVSAVDQALEASPLDRADVWRHHATTLLPPLAARLESEEEAVIASLPASIGRRNLQAFAQLRGALDDGDAPVADTRELIAAASADDGRGIGARRRLVRELVHTTLHQLQQPVRAHIPLVLFAWHSAAGHSAAGHSAAGHSAAAGGRS